MNNNGWFNLAANTGQQIAINTNTNTNTNTTTGLFRAQVGTISCDSCNGGYPTSSMYNATTCPTGTIPSGSGNPCTTQQSLVSCNKCMNGSPVGITQAAPGQCPAGSSESLTPCTMIQCYTCGAGNNPVSTGLAFPMDPYDGCNPTGTGPGTKNPNGGCSTTPPPTITCYECLNGTAQGKSYIGLTTCPPGETTDPNPCNPVGPALQDDCYNCASQTMHRVARGTCVNAVDVMVSQVDPNTGVSHNPCPATQLLGCIDVSANNFNPLANTDDGTCAFDIPGCTDATALNYNPIADVNDGSCTFPIPGCTDPTALNYNPNAGVDDGSCGYTDPVLGCTDMTADNFNPAAVVDDGSCTFAVIPSLLGCTDPTADNFDALVDTDDGTCEYEEDIEEDEELEIIEDDIKTAGLAGDNKMMMYIAIGIGVLILMKK